MPEDLQGVGLGLYRKEVGLGSAVPMGGLPGVTSKFARRVKRAKVVQMYYSLNVTNSTNVLPQGSQVVQMYYR